MAPYWLLFILSCVFCFFDFIKFKIEDRFLFYSFQVLIMILFSGLRYDCDFDYLPYKEIFETTPTFGEWFELLGTNIPAQTYGEPLFVVACMLLKTIGLPITGLMLLISFLTFYFLAKFTWSFTKYPFTSLFLYNALYFLAGGFTQIRFGLCTVIVLNALLALYNGKVKTYFLLILFAAGFHVTALIGLLVVPFYYLKFNKLFLIIISICGVVISFIDLNIVIIEYFFNLESETSYSAYLTEIDYLTKAPNTILIIYLFVLIIFIYFSNKAIGLSLNKSNLLITIGALSLLVGGFTIQVNILARFTVLLQIVFIFIIPYLFYYFRFKSVAYALLLSYAIFKFAQFLSPGGFILPYKNVIFS